MTSSGYRILGAIAIVGIGIAPAVAGGAQAPADCDVKSAWRSVNHLVNNDRRTIKWSRPDCRIEYEIVGEITFNDDLTGIARMASGAKLDLEEEEGRSERRLEVRAGSDGRPVYAYSVDGTRRAFDAGAQAWFARRVQILVRETGLGADRRVAYLLGKGGHDAVLREVATISSSHVQRLYLTQLIEQARLNGGALENVLRVAGTELGSDYELAQFITAVLKQHAGQSGLPRAAIEATRGLDSDYERRRVLSAVLKLNTLTSADVAALLASASEIGSDYELASLLIGIASRYALAPSSRAAFFKAAASIDSDYEQRRVFSALLKQKGLTTAERAELIRLASSIDSDYELAQVLRSAATAADLTDGHLRAAWFAALGSISSDYERRRTLSGLVASGDLSQDALAEVIDAAAAIRSDHDSAELLVAISKRYRLTGELREAYLRAADAIRSEHEQNRVAAALLRAERGGTR